MSKTFTIYSGERLEDLLDKCKNLVQFPQVLLDRQISPIDTGVFEFGFFADKTPKNYTLANTEHLLAFLGHFPQALWSMVKHDVRLIQGRGITLHVSLYPHSSKSGCGYDEKSDDGKAYISPVPLCSARNKYFALHVRKIAEAPKLSEIVKTRNLEITPFAGSLAQFLHREEFAFQVFDQVKTLQREVVVQSTKARAGLLPIGMIYSELGVCVSRDEALEQMRVNRKRPGTLPQLMVYLRDTPEHLTSNPIITLSDDGFECRLLPSQGAEPDALLIDRYLPCQIGDHFQSSYFYLDE